MKLHSIQTLIGAATLADLNHHPQHSVDCPDGWGLIIWGRCDRVTFGTIVCNSKAEWIADYSPNNKVAIVIHSLREDVKVGDRVTFGTTCVDAICPNCGSTHYVSSGVNWRCKDCDRQWRKEIQKRGRPKTLIK
jgi:predicted RNA-binding Zn-ribbon protein involved in translation (DUF1610 family)